MMAETPVITVGMGGKSWQQCQMLIGSLINVAERRIDTPEASGIIHTPTGKYEITVRKIE